MSHMHLLKSERGSSVVEFLICAPILAILTYAAYDWNRRIENQQTVTIAARNTVLLGSRFSQSQLNEIVKKQLDVEGQILDDAERNQVLGSLYVGVDANKKLGQTEIDRIKAATGFNTGGQGQGSSFDTMSNATGSVAAATAQGVEKIQAIGEPLGILIKDGIRTAGVETKADGSQNAIQSAIGILAKAASNDKKADKEVLAVERRFGQRFYFRQESGYHPNDHTAVDGAAVAMGLMKNAWGGGGDFDDGASEIQSRCMTRLHGSDACGSGGTHKFQDKVAKVADFKLIVSGVFTVLENIPWTKAIGAAANGIAQGVTIVPACLAHYTIVEGAGLANTVLGALDKTGSSGGGGGNIFGSQMMPQLQSPDIVNSFSSELSPDLFKKKAGG